jgi:hypothetical protein
MATNNITSGKLPRRLNPHKISDGASVSAFAGDRKKESMNGARGRLSQVASQPMAAIEIHQRDRLLRKAGVTVRRGR